MGEFGATITFVSNIWTQRLPSAIYALTQVPGGDAGALRLALVSDGELIALLADRSRQDLADQCRRRPDGARTRAR
jgi:molybdate transport system permease protein